MIHNWYIQKLKYISEVLGLFNNGVKMHLKGILHSRHIVCSIWTGKSEFPSFQSVISTGNAPWSRKNHHQSWPQNHRWLLHTSTAAVICCLLALLSSLCLIKSVLHTALSIFYLWTCCSDLCKQTCCSVLDAVNSGVMSFPAGTSDFRGQWSAAILNCDSRKRVGVSNNSDNSLLYSSVLVSHDSVTWRHNTRTLRLKLLNGIQPSFILRFPPVPFLLWHVKILSLTNKTHEHQARCLHRHYKFSTSGCKYTVDKTRWQKKVDFTP